MSEPEFEDERNPALRDDPKHETSKPPVHRHPDELRIRRGASERHESACGGVCAIGSRRNLFDGIETVCRHPLPGAWLGGKNGDLKGAIIESRTTITYISSNNRDLLG